MAFCRLVLAFIVISIASTYGKIQVPVYLWGDTGISRNSNPLSSISELEFETILQQKLEEVPFTVIFIDETLSVEDFSLKDSNGETVFPYLHAIINDATYLPAVEDASTVLNRLADSKKVNRVKLNDGGLSAEINPEGVDILFITLEDVKEGESRIELLRRHNNFMEEVMSKLRELQDKVVAIYTAQNPSWTVSESHSRVRREAENTDLHNVTLDGLKLYVNKVVVTVDTTVSNVTAIDSSSSEINEKQNMSTTLTSGDSSFTLNFLSQAGYWIFSSVTYRQAGNEVILLPESEVFAPLGFAYRCGQNVTFSNRINQTLIATFQDLKVQPYFMETSNITLLYGDSINCVGFFSVPIWSGLFVTFILLAITFYGIIMMMDIRTMDRFDDPKGKTITINAGE